MNKILAACGLLAANVMAAQAEPVTLASTVPNTGINAIVVDTLTEELANADMKIDAYLDGTLGGERELIDLVKMGETQIHMGVIHSAQYFPELDATLIPYLFPDYASIKRFLASETGDQLKVALEERGNAKFLGTYYQGPRWTTSNQPFTTLEELKGQKIRMPEIPIWIEIWSGLGAVTTPMPSPEVFSGLQTGVIDAQENMLSNIFGRRLYEVQDYLINTAHQQSYVTVMVNLDYWNELSPEKQDALQKAVDTATEAGTDATYSENERIKAEILDAGLELVELKPEFREAALPVIEKAAHAQLADGVYEAALEAVKSSE